MMRSDIDNLIQIARKNGDSIRVLVLQAIKNEFIKFEKEGKVLTELDETKILLKMQKQRKDTINEYLSYNANKQAESEQNELNILNEYIPDQPSDEDISNYTKQVAESFTNLSMKDMKTILAVVQGKYPTANGKIVSQIVKSLI